MKLQDGSILMHGDLEHRAPYDPRKAHEYYLRTRKLKGRERGKEKPTSLSDLSKAADVVSITGFNRPKPKKKAKQLSPTQQYLKTVNVRLAELNKQLKVKLADAGSHQKLQLTPKTTKKAAKDKTPDPEQSAEDLKNQITNLKGRLTAAVAKLEKLSEAAP